MMIVPKGKFINSPGDGFKFAMKTLTGGRIGIASRHWESVLRTGIKLQQERKPWQTYIQPPGYSI